MDRNEEVEPEPHDAHVIEARALFRAVGFDIAAMRFPRPPEALEVLRRFNSAPDGWQHPFAWGYFPNKWFADNWRTAYPAHCYPTNTAKDTGDE